MGHRCFGSQIRTPKLLKIYNKKQAMADSNGIRKLTEDQRKMAEEKRQSIRDQVSKRMGDMLLRGYTMLDAYCDTCTGILMEDRRGNRECIQCELLRRELQSSSGDVRVAEIPLNPNDDVDDALDDDDKQSNELQDAGPSGHLPYNEIGKDDGPKGYAKGLERLLSSKIEKLGNQTEAGEKDEQKRNEIENTNDLGRICQLHAVMKGSIEILQMLENYGCGV
uniref:Sjogrens syndrome scleroderma autoantigen 1 n=1 Tax=Syphacia muris TaxID=451379 RepID=A0A0N5AF04_9BILA